jgi:hypothetical protein
MRFGEILKDSSKDAIKEKLDEGKAVKKADGLPEKDKKDTQVLDDWKNADVQRLGFESFEYISDEKKKELKVVKDGNQDRYYDAEGKIIYVDYHREYEDEEEYASSSEGKRVEYSYDEGKKVSGMIFYKENHSDYDQVITSECIFGKVDYEYDGERLKKISALVVSDVYEDYKGEYRKKEVISLDFVYDKNGEVERIYRHIVVEKSDGEKEKKTRVVYDRSEKELAGRDLERLIEDEITKYN